MLQGYIVDPETGQGCRCNSPRRGFRDDEEGAKIAIVLNANLYDLSGNLVGRLDGPHAIDVRTWSMPIAVRSLLEETAHHPVSAVKRKGRPESRPFRLLKCGAKTLRRLSLIAALAWVSRSILRGSVARLRAARSGSTATVPSASVTAIAA